MKPKPASAHSIVTHNMNKDLQQRKERKNINYFRPLFKKKP